MRARRVRRLDADASVAVNTARILRVRLAELYAFDPHVRDPTNVDALHDMRIAAKRLRYVLEIAGHCVPVLGAEAEAVARSLQDVLGEIHDCDVLIPRVDHELALLREHDALALARLSPDIDTLPGAVRRAPARSRYRGLATLGAALTARRALLHDAFAKEWAAVVESDLRGRLEQALDRIDP
jgi:CHAD domain-containing protein